MAPFILVKENKKQMKIMYQIIYKRVDKKKDNLQKEHFTFKGW